MKTFFCLVAVIGFVRISLAYSPIIDGALADVRIRVVDDRGEAVPDATISVTFYTAPEKVNVRRGKTDAEGFFSAKGRCIGEAHAWIRKDGYYETVADPAFQTLPESEEQTSRKWSGGTVETVTTLKKKRRPASLTLNHRQYWPFPATNEVFTRDLEMCQWCPPYGNGRHADLRFPILPLLPLVSASAACYNIHSPKEGSMFAIRSGKGRARLTRPAKGQRRP